MDKKTISNLFVTYDDSGDNAEVFNGQIKFGITIFNLQIFFIFRKKGYLNKKGIFNKSWRKRWCMVIENNLFYAKSHDTKDKTLGCIPLGEALIKVCLSHVKILDFF